MGLVFTVCTGKGGCDFGRIRNMAGTDQNKIVQSPRVKDIFTYSRTKVRKKRQIRLGKGSKKDRLTVWKTVGNKRQSKESGKGLTKIV